jgi:hypothetical protein
MKVKVIARGNEIEMRAETIRLAINVVAVNRLLTINDIFPLDRFYISFRARPRLRVLSRRFTYTEFFR